MPSVELVRLHHVSFGVKDLAASKRFFGGALGLEEIERPNFSFSGAWYQLADRQLHLIEQDVVKRETPERVGRCDHVALEVKDIEQVKQALSAAGIDYGEGGNHALGMDQVFCRDPDGHTIEFVRYRDG